MTINYKSDFSFRLTVLDTEGTTVDLRRFAWTARLTTSLRRVAFTASHSAGGEYHSAIPDPDAADGSMRIILDGHGLPPGQLALDLTVHVPDATFPDGIRDVTIRTTLPIELTAAPDDLPADAQAEATIPVIIQYDNDAIIDCIDSLNTRLDDILGGKTTIPGSSGTAPAATPTGPLTLQRGIISINARPGVIYRNFGCIRFPMNDQDSRTFDISHVPESIRAVPDLGDTFTARRNLEDGRVSRLAITGPDEDYPYIRRNPDTGHFERFRCDIPVLDTPLAPPDVRTIAACVHDTTTDQDLYFRTLREYLDHVAARRHIDLQIRRRYKRSNSDGGDFTIQKWVTRKDWRHWSKTRGIIRIRYRTRRRRSPWVVLSFKHTDGSALYIRIL